jgi:hypothetical protein
LDVADGSCNVPSAPAYIFNATAIPSTALGWLTLWPSGEPQPSVSTLNAYDGWVTSNMAIVPAASGSVNVFTTDPSHLILDIVGLLRTINIERAKNALRPRVGEHFFALP